MSFLRRKYWGAGNNAPWEPVLLNRASPQAQGLVGWWPLNDPGNIRDLSGRGYHERLADTTGTQTKVPGPFANYVTDFANDGEIALPHIIEITSAVNVSFSCWVVYQDTRDIFDGLMGQEESGNANDRLSLSIGSVGFGELTGTVFLIGNGGNTFIHSSDQNIPNQDEVYFIVGTYDGSQATAADRADIWTNGILSAKTVVGTLPTTTGAMAFHAWIGSIPAGAGARDHGGLIWDVRMYNKTLNAGEIRAMYAPETRWDLYWQPKQIVTVPFGTVVPVATSSLHPILRRRRR